MLLLVLMFIRLHLSMSVMEDTFHAGTLCDLEERVNSECSILVRGVHTLSACVFKCSKDSSCIGISLSGQDKLCYQHFQCPSISSCKKKELDHKYVAKNCAHGGEWSPSDSVCSCVDGWIGRTCSDLPSSCKDLYDFGYRGGVRAHIDHGKASGFEPTPVACRIANSGWNVISILENTGNLNPNRTWEEYKNGFYLDGRNLWIGLDHWHALSKEGYSKLTFSITDGNHQRAYFGFSLENETSKFSFTFSSTSTYSTGRPLDIDFGDCLGPLQNTAFSTLGMDNDGVEGKNCASNMGIGWWYAGNCSLACNLFGMAPADWDNVRESQRMSVLGADMALFKDMSFVRISVFTQKP